MAHQRGILSCSCGLWLGDDLAVVGRVARDRWYVLPRVGARHKRPAIDIFYRRTCRGTVADEIAARVVDIQIDVSDWSIGHIGHVDMDGIVWISRVKRYRNVYRQGVDVTDGGIAGRIKQPCAAGVADDAGDIAGPSLAGAGTGHARSVQRATVASGKCRCT